MLKYWYAVQVRVRHENKIIKYLEKQKKAGFPIGEAIAFKDVLPGYVFVQSNRWPEPYFRGTTSMCRIIGQVTEDEIRGLARAPTPIPFKNGQAVQVMNGPLSGLIGKIRYAGRDRSRVTVTFMKESVSMQVDNEYLQVKEGS